MDSDSSDSTSDEEYVPPPKLSDTESSDEQSFSGGEPESGELDVSELKKNIGKKKNIGPPVSDQHITDAETKAKEDAIWSEFLMGTDNSVPYRTAEKPTSITRGYQFAGEVIEVTERLPASSQFQTVRNTESLEHRQTTVLTDHFTDKTPSSESPASHPQSGPKSNLSSVLQNLRSVGGSKIPKLTTLEKSRLDWQQFIRKENIEDDLKAHNKGKDGYLERRAFVDRTVEREYDYQRALKTRKL